MLATLPGVMVSAVVPPRVAVLELEQTDDAAGLDQILEVYLRRGFRLMHWRGPGGEMLSRTAPRCRGRS
jgi:hypothetical protein